MGKTKKIFAVLIIAAMVLSGCSTNDKNNADVGAEYPKELFPIYHDATVYSYKFDKGIIDISFGTDEDYEKVGKYYSLLFEHSKYEVTAEKLTNMRFVSSGKTNLYKYLLEVNKAESRKDKKVNNTIINLRIVINDFVLDSGYSATPTPEPVDKITAAPTSTLAPTDSPKPQSTHNAYSDFDVISTIDMQEESIFIECLDVSENDKGNGLKNVSVKLKIVNYGEEQTGYISVDDFVLVDSLGNFYHSDMSGGIFSRGVNILPGGYCVDDIDFVVESSLIYSVLAIPEGLGSRITNSYDMELAPLSPPDNPGSYDEAIAEVYDISSVPTFIIGQEYIIDNMLKIRLNDARYFTNNTTVNLKNLMYTFSMEFTNISDDVIIPVELREFVLFDIKHNIMIKTTSDLTPYDELAFNSIQSGLSEDFNISFEVFEEVGENYLCLLLVNPSNQDEKIIFKIR
ncbi:MAG: hypothetical protein AB1Z23_05105 [Eubacteriales bacterium]